MSAFFVSKPTIDDVVTLIITFAEVPMDSIDAAAFGRELWLNNASAICQRYRGDKMENYAAEIAAYQFAKSNQPLPALVKSLDCYLYQCSEGDVPETDLHKQLAGAAKRLGALKKHPEYAAAPWGRD